MKDELSPTQALFLWRMLAAETAEAREPTLSTALPKLNVNKERAPLVSNGYLVQDRRGATTYLRLTDKAWAWAEASVGVEFPSDPASQTLQGLLRRVLPFLQQHGLPLASLFSNDRALQLVLDARAAAGKKPREKPSEKSNTPKERVPRRLAKKKVSKKATARTKKATKKKVATGAALDEALAPIALTTRIEEVCLALANGRRKQRVRLSALRSELPDVSRQALDQALLDLQDAGRAVLYRDDNTAALTRADHEAALIVGNAPRHLVYLEA